MWTGSKLVQIMACRLFGAKPLLEPMLTFLNWILTIKLKWSSNQDTKFFIHENIFKNAYVKWRPFCPMVDELNIFLDCAGDGCLPCVQRGTVMVSRNTRLEQLGSLWLHSMSSPDTMVVRRLLPNHCIIYCQNRMADIWQFWQLQFGWWHFVVKPLSESLLTRFHDAIWRHRLGLSE